jgi:hypothetical protein
MAPAQYPAMLRKGTRWCGDSAILCQEERASWPCANDWRRKSKTFELESTTVAEWAAMPI